MAFAESITIWCVQTLAPNSYGKKLCPSVRASMLAHSRLTSSTTCGLSGRQRHGLTIAVRSYSGPRRCSDRHTQLQYRQLHAILVRPWPRVVWHAPVPQQESAKHDAASHRPWKNSLVSLYLHHICVALMYASQEQRTMHISCASDTDSL